MLDTLDQKGDPLVGLGVEAMLMENPQEWILDSPRLKVRKYIIRLYRRELRRVRFRSKWRTRRLNLYTALLSSRWLELPREAEKEYCWIETQDDGTRLLVTTFASLKDGQLGLREEKLPVLIASPVEFRDATVI